MFLPREKLAVLTPVAPGSISLASDLQQDAAQNSGGREKRAQVWNQADSDSVSRPPLGASALSSLKWGRAEDAGTSHSFH